MRCFLCGNKDFGTVYTLPQKNIVRCPNDGLFFSQMKTKGKLYGKKYYAAAPYPKDSNQKYFKDKLETLKKFTGETNPTILDVGCGWGDFEEVLEKEHYKYLGIDTDEEAIKICRKKGLNCIKGDINKLLLGGKKGRDGIFRQNLTLKFSAVIFFQVLEHQKDPLKFLTSATKLLKKNGIILITTPNNDSPLRKILGKHWSVYNEPSHFVFYDLNTLKKVLIKAGLRSIIVRRDNFRKIGLNYILGRLGANFNDKLFEQISLPTDPFGDLTAIARLNQTKS